MLKQRLVGFIVLGALAIIFWPIVFVSPEPEEELMLPVFDMPDRPDLVMSERREPILERVDRSRLPTIERAENPDTITVDVIATDPQGELIAADNEPNGQVASRQRAQFDTQGLPVSWELQVATLSAQRRATEVLAVLQDKGYKAYIIPIRLSGQDLYQIRVGPMLQKKRLLNIKRDIDEYFEVNSVVIRFVPN